MNEIKAFRKSQGWTQKNMAEYLDIPLITYVQWENGTRTPPNYVINLIKYKLKNDTQQIKIPNLENDKIYLLWYTNHRINDYETLYGAYKNKENAKAKLDYEQNKISTEIIEFHIEEIIIKN